jgi:hypothetical protein
MSYERLIALPYHSESTITEFAAEIGIAPGIVVGRLQHDHLVNYGSSLSSLKMRIKSEYDMHASENNAEKPVS